MGQFQDRLGQGLAVALIQLGSGSCTGSPCSPCPSPAWSPQPRACHMQGRHHRFCQSPEHFCAFPLSRNGWRWELGSLQSSAPALGVVRTQRNRSDASYPSVTSNPLWDCTSEMGRDQLIPHVLGLPGAPSPRSPWLTAGTVPLWHRQLLHLHAPRGTRDSLDSNSIRRVH